MTKIVLIITLSICLYSCESRQTDKLDESSKTVKSLIDSIANKLNQTENFDDFINKFYSDTNFMRTRLILPLKGKRTTMTENGTEIADWSNINMKSIGSYKDVVNEAKDMKLKHTFEKTDDIIIEKIFVENSGFSVKRVFELRDKKWYMTEYNVTYI